MGSRGQKLDLRSSSVLSRSSKDRTHPGISRNANRTNDRGYDSKWCEGKYDTIEPAVGFAEELLCKLLTKKGENTGELVSCCTFKEIVKDVIREELTELDPRTSY